MSLFANARGWLGTQAQLAAGVSVVYSRTGQTSLNLTAIPGRTVFASNQDGGARIEFGDRDYLIEAEDLTYGEPAIGDRVTEVIDGTTHVFECLTPTTGEPAWRWSDSLHTRYRIHCKRIDP
jgi:hypothetical protein